MATTDVVELLRQGIRTAVNADTTLHGIMGRTTRLIVPFNNTLQDAEMPVIAYHVVYANEIGGAGDNREVMVQFSVFDEGSTASERIANIIEVLETKFRPAVLVAMGLTDGFVRRRARRDGDEDPENATARRRADIDHTFWVTK